MTNTDLRSVVLGQPPFGVPPVVCDAWDTISAYLTTEHDGAWTPRVACVEDAAADVDASRRLIWQLIDAAVDLGIVELDNEEQTIRMRTPAPNGHDE